MTRKILLPTFKTQSRLSSKSGVVTLGGGARFVTVLVNRRLTSGRLGFCSEFGLFRLEFISEFGGFGAYGKFCLSTLVFV